MRRSLALLVVMALATGCPGEEVQEPPVDPPQLDVHSQAHGCFTVASDAGTLSRGGTGFEFSTLAAEPLYFQPSDLGTYLLYDVSGGYVVADGTQLLRQVTLQSDATLFDDSYISGAEWLLQTSRNDFDRYQLRSRRTGGLMAATSLADTTEDAVAVSFEPAEGCTPHPELALNATGSITRTSWDDGDLFGFVDMHSHMFTNFGFGGGLFHGSPFHRLGIEHAMPDCSGAHGTMGRKDFMGYAYDKGQSAGGFSSLIPDMLDGELSEDNHATAGYPDFTDWPDVRKRSTHQAQYHRWLERSWLGGLRLVVQHATSNAVICNLTVGEGWAPARYDCEDMTAVDQEIDAAYAMERYVDAQSGGPGLGWFRIVHSPPEARDVIASGKLAIVLGIETSDLFNCHLSPRPGGPTCDEAHVNEQLDTYYERGVRVLFPQHKFDNAFAPGDGSDGFIEVGNFMNSGYYTNMVTEDCPTDVPSGFDRGPVTFGGLLEPREEYMTQAPVDLTDFPLAPLETILPFVAQLLQPEVPGDHCQNGSLTPIGEHLVTETMRRGMILDVDHLPRRAYKRAFEMLEEADYPALSTHGRDNHGKLFDLGGLSQGSFGRCHDGSLAGSSLNGYKNRLTQMVEAGMHPSLGFAFDINGFAGGPGPRFGDEGCNQLQTNPLSYPFEGYDSGLSFTRPIAGNRVYDFDTEGMLHVGLIPEYIQDARNDGATDEDLEPLFRSAEGWIRLWERAELRSTGLRADPQRTGL